MIRVGRFEVDETDPRGVDLLVESAWIPRGRREAIATRLLAGSRALRGPRVLRLLGAPDRTPASAAPARDHAIAAVREALRDPAWTAPLELLGAPTAAVARRLFFGWGAGGPSVAKVAASGAGPLLVEASSLREQQASPLVPRLLCSAESLGLQVLVLDALPGEPLLRRQRLAPPVTAWPEDALGELGTAIGRRHAATRRADGLARVHGDLWSRNVLVSRGRLAGIVDWEAARWDAPAAEAAGFLRASARADAAGRAEVPGPRLAEWPPGALAFLHAWAEALGDPRRLIREAEDLLRTGDPT